MWTVLYVKWKTRRMMSLLKALATEQFHELINSVHLPPVDKATIWVIHEAGVLV